jgi:hypothetical protein
MDQTKKKKTPINPTFQYHNAHDALVRSVKDAILALLTKDALP